MFDVDQQISAVRRRVGHRVLDAGEARVVTVSQTYDAALEEVWDACTNPERIPRWFLPVSGDLRVGGTYQLEGNAGGTIERCDPPRSFAATWEFDGQVSWVEVRLSADAGMTRFELEHVVPVDAHWEQFGPGATGVGWDLGIMALARHLAAGPSAVDPQQAEEWSASDDGRRFMALSGQRWGAAETAAGEDPDVARAREARTIAAYTGAPAPAD